MAELVPALGYEDEIAGNIRTALETRLNSLRMGAKGLLLDTPLSVPIATLLKEPVILELEGVGDDDEKAFIMGLILVSIYEHYQVQGQPATDRVQHVTVVEEAHRLLANVAPSVSSEAGNPRGKAVETFVNMLSEVRAYGEGLVIAEQIPTKLAPDVIKNTALKVMHRLVANDDRQVMGGAMNLDAPQLRQIVSLATGVAAVHGGGHYGDDNPILIQVPRVKSASVQPLGAAEIRRSWEQFRDAHSLKALYVPYPTCDRLCADADRSACSQARSVADQHVVTEHTAAVFTTVAAAGAPGRDLVPVLTALLNDWRQTVQPLWPGRAPGTEELRCVLTHALYHLVDRLAAQYGWPYTRAESLLSLLLAAASQALTGAASPLSGGSAALEQFAQAVATMCLLPSPPYAYCAQACGRPCLCLYRYTIAPLTLDPELRADLADAGIDGPGLATACESAAERVLLFGELPVPGTEPDRHAFQNAALCFLIQSTANNPSTWPARARSQAILTLLAHYTRVM
ncbi:MAG: ATP-binding protein [Anaerolineae bacterium]